MTTTCTRYTYTGDDQLIITAPPNAVGMTVKLWGAGGSRAPNGRKADWAFTAGCGGHTSAEFDDQVVRPGDEFTLVVACAGYTSQTSVNGQQVDWNLIPSGAGFGGVGDRDSGGGLSGVFTGGEAVIATEKNRALAVAGGGGSYDAQAWGDGSEGGNGNSPTSGGETATMRGSSDTVLDGDDLVYANGNDCDTGNKNFGSSGGGGYEGGGRTRSQWPQYEGNNWFQSCGYEVAAARGGSGYVHPSANTSVINFTADGPSGIPPNTDDPDYVDGVGVKGNLTINEGGHGLAVVCWIIVTPEPTSTPTSEPTSTPTSEPTSTPTEDPTEEPTKQPTVKTTEEATESTCPQGQQANANRTSCCPATEGVFEYGEDCAVLSCTGNYGWNAERDGCVVNAAAEESDLTLLLVLSILGFLLLCSSLITAVVYAVKARRSPPPAKTIETHPMMNCTPEEPAEEQPLDHNDYGPRYSNGASRRWLTGAGMGIQSQSNHMQTVVFHTQQEETPARATMPPAANHRMLYGSSYNPFPVVVPTTTRRVSAVETGVRTDLPPPRPPTTAAREENLQQLVLGGPDETEGAGAPRVTTKELSARLADMI